MVACTYHVVNFHLFDIRLISVGADLPPSLVIGLVAKNHRVVRVRQGVVELRVPFIVFDCVRRSGLKQGFGHSRLPIVFIDLPMATRAKPGVDVFIYWSAFRWGYACDWYPGFSPSTHNESTHAENEPNHAAEAEPATETSYRLLAPLVPKWRLRVFGHLAGKKPEELDQICGSFERLQTPVIHVSYIITTLQRRGVLKATFSASDSFEVGRVGIPRNAPMEPSLFALGMGPIVRWEATMFT